MLKEHVHHEYGQIPLPPEFMVKRDLFAIAVQDGIIGIYVDDDGWYGLQMEFAEQWLPCLKEAIAAFEERRKRP